eukprot:1136311-Pleurochrysis_carterae.AAC.6
MLSSRNPGGRATSKPLQWGIHQAARWRVPAAGPPSTTVRRVGLSHEAAPNGSMRPCQDHTPLTARTGPPSASAPQQKPPPPLPAADIRAGAPPAHSAGRPQHASGQRADSRGAENANSHDAVGAPADRPVPQGTFHALATSSHPHEGVAAPMQVPRGFRAPSRPPWLPQLPNPPESTS